MWDSNTSRPAREPDYILSLQAVNYAIWFHEMLYCPLSLSHTPGDVCQRLTLEIIANSHNGLDQAYEDWKQLVEDLLLRGNDK